MCAILHAIGPCLQVVQKGDRKQPDARAVSEQLRAAARDTLQRQVPSVCLRIACLSVCLSVCLSIFLSVCLSVWRCDVHDLEVSPHTARNSRLEASSPECCARTVQDHALALQYAHA